MMYVPKGFAHGFISLKPETEILYLVSDFYAPDCEKTLIWNDKDIWNQVANKPKIISDKDKSADSLKQTTQLNYKINEIKKIYITGVSGFIGSSLAKKCLESGHSVIGITRNSASEISKQLKIKVIEADLLKEANLEIENADVVIHCATANDILSKNINEGYSLSINGTSNLLEASKRANISNFIFFSTAQVYGTELKDVLMSPQHLIAKQLMGLIII